MKDLKGLLSIIRDELEKGRTVAIFFRELLSQTEPYDEPIYIDYTVYGFDKSNILDALRELEKNNEITITDSGNMGWWIKLPKN